MTGTKTIDLRPMSFELIESYLVLHVLFVRVLLVRVIIDDVVPILYFRPSRRRRKENRVISSYLNGHNTKENNIRMQC